MKSWIMTFWLENHDKSEWPDLTICQTEDACHVTDTKNHPSKDVIEKMCSDEFFAKHKYKYVDHPSVTVKDDEDYAYAYCPKAGNSAANESLDVSSEYQAAYSSPNPVERDTYTHTDILDDTYVAMNQEPKEPDDNESGYLCPIAIEAEQRSDNEDRSSNQDTTEGFDTPPVAYENVAYLLDEAHTSHDEDAGFIAKHEPCLDKYENMDDDGSLDSDPLACLYQNAAAFLTCTHPTVSDQLVPQSDHLYANMQEKVDVVTKDTRSQLDTEAG